MKLATLRLAGNHVPAIQLSSGEFVNLAAASRIGLLAQPIQRTEQLLDDRAPVFADVQGLIEKLETGQRDVVAKLREVGAIHGDDADLACPINPGFIFSAGNAYKDHLEEMKSALPTRPAGFVKSPRSLNGPRDAILLPPHESDLVDFEGEFCIVFGRSCYNVTPAEALDCIGGYTMGNDVSARTVVSAWIASLRGGDAKDACDLLLDNILGKQFPTFFPLGPVVATRDEIPDPHDVNIGTRLNGELMQSANTGNLLFSLGETIAYFARWQRFEPGDVLTTGSPSGVGFGRNPQVFLKDGDVVEVFGAGIGSLMNPVRAT